MMTVLPMGDTAVCVTWDISQQETLGYSRALLAAINVAGIDGILDVVPAFASVTVHYNPCQLTLHEVDSILQELSSKLDLAIRSKSRLVKIPVCYDVEFALDLLEICESLQLSQGDIVKLHCEPEYVVQMIGFSPGFPYLTGLSQQLHLPRRATPRLEVPVGSVAIGGKQTGIYSLSTPGGWQVIGRTPLSLFVPESNPPCLLEAGDRIRFFPISRDEFRLWQSSA